jgi:hypothetical protein
MAREFAQREGKTAVTDGKKATVPVQDGAMVHERVVHRAQIEVGISERQFHDHRVRAGKRDASL